MEAIATLLQDDPYLRMTPKERAEARRARRAKLAAQGVPDTPVSCPSASARIASLPKLEIKEIPPEPIFSFGQWVERQERLNPLPQKLWFSMECGDEPTQPRYPKIEEIQRAVCVVYRISKAKLVCERRLTELVRARQVGMYLCKTLTTRSLPEIGRKFGNRDHSTVLHAVRRITNLLPIDPALASEIDMLKASLLEAA